VREVFSHRKDDLNHRGGTKSIVSSIGKNGTAKRIGKEWGRGDWGLEALNNLMQRPIRCGNPTEWETVTVRTF